MTADKQENIKYNTSKSHDEWQEIKDPWLAADKLYKRLQDIQGIQTEKVKKLPNRPSIFQKWLNNILNLIPPLRGFLSDCKDFFNRWITVTDNSIAKNSTLQSGVQYAGLGLDILRFIRIPLAYLLAVIQNKKLISMKSSNKAKWLKAAILLGLTIVAISAPVTASIIGLIGAGFGFIAATFILGRRIWERKQHQQAIDNIDQQIKNLIKVKTLKIKGGLWELLQQSTRLEKQLIQEKKHTKENNTRLEKSINELEEQITRLEHCGVFIENNQFRDKKDLKSALKKLDCSQYVLLGQDIYYYSKLEHTLNNVIPPINMGSSIENIKKWFSDYTSRHSNNISASKEEIKQLETLIFGGQKNSVKNNSPRIQELKTLGKLKKLYADREFHKEKLIKKNPFTVFARGVEVYVASLTLIGMILSVAGFPPIGLAILTAAAAVAILYTAVRVLGPVVMTLGKILMKKLSDKNLNQHSQSLHHGLTPSASSEKSISQNSNPIPITNLTPIISSTSAPTINHTGTFQDSYTGLNNQHFCYDDHTGQHITEKFKSSFEKLSTPPPQGNDHESYELH